jgi:coenzyme F420-0:L-glutamate ligase / coenzyme F420-1:gamma-L-glutamate ligase
VSGGLEIIPVEGLPEITEGTRLGELIGARAELRDGDVLVVSQKVVSKAEGRLRRLAEVAPGEEAVALGRRLGKDPRLVQLVLNESREVLRAERGVLITETRQGLVCANAGVDSSNVPAPETVSLLPEDADASARRIRAELRERAELAVVVSDSIGRPWRLGQAEVAIGCAGLTALDDWRGRPDATGRELTATLIAVADEVAAAADLARDKDSAVPASVVRGLARFVTAEDGAGAAALRRPRADDLFR